MQGGAKLAPPYAFLKRLLKLMTSVTPVCASPIEFPNSQVNETISTLHLPPKPVDQPPPPPLVERKVLDAFQITHSILRSEFEKASKNGADFISRLESFRGCTIGVVAAYFLYELYKNSPDIDAEGISYLVLVCRKAEKLSPDDAKILYDAYVKGKLYFERLQPRGGQANLNLTQVLFKCSAAHLSPIDPYISVPSEEDYRKTWKLEIDEIENKILLDEKKEIEDKLSEVLELLNPDEKTIPNFTIVDMLAFQFYNEVMRHDAFNKNKNSLGMYIIQLISSIYKLGVELELHNKPRKLLKELVNGLQEQFNQLIKETTDKGLKRRIEVLKQVSSERDMFAFYVELSTETSPQLNWIEIYGYYFDLYRWSFECFKTQFMKSLDHHSQVMLDCIDYMIIIKGMDKKVQDNFIKVFDRDFVKIGLEMKAFLEKFIKFHLKLNHRYKQLLSEIVTLTSFMRHYTSHDYRTRYLHNRMMRSIEELDVIADYITFNQHFNNFYSIAAKLSVFKNNSSNLDTITRLFNIIDSSENMADLPFLNEVTLKGLDALGSYLIVSMHNNHTHFLAQSGLKFITEGIEKSVGPQEHWDVIFGWDDFQERRHKDKTQKILKRAIKKKQSAQKVKTKNPSTTIHKNESSQDIHYDLQKENLFVIISALQKTVKDLKGAASIDNDFFLPFTKCNVVFTYFLNDIYQKEMKVQGACSYAKAHLSQAFDHLYLAFSSFELMGKAIAEKDVDFLAFIIPMGLQNLYFIEEQFESALMTLNTKDETHDHDMTLLLKGSKRWSALAPETREGYKDYENGVYWSRVPYSMQKAYTSRKKAVPKGLALVLDALNLMDKDPCIKKDEILKVVHTYVDFFETACELFKARASLHPNLCEIGEPFFKILHSFFEEFRGWSTVQIAQWQINPIPIPQNTICPLEGKDCSIPLKDARSHLMRMQIVQKKLEQSSNHLCISLISGLLNIQWAIEQFYNAELLKKGLPFEDRHHFERHQEKLQIKDDAVLPFNFKKGAHYFRREAKKSKIPLLSKCVTLLDFCVQESQKEKDGFIPVGSKDNIASQIKSLAGEIMTMLEPGIKRTADLLKS